MEENHHLFVGAPRGRGQERTVGVFSSKLRRMGGDERGRLLDVGCGDGTFTEALAQKGHSEVHGIDVQPEYIETFKGRVAGNEKFHVHEMSASDMSFEDGYFDQVVSIETFEHVPDLQRSAAEVARVLRPDGTFLITVPNRFFPFENHGIKIGNWERRGRIPLLPWIPFLHDRWSSARVFTVKSLDRLFCPCGLERVDVDYAWPTFEHAGNRLQPILKPLYPLMRGLEKSPLKFFGTSVIVKYRRK